MYTIICSKLQSCPEEFFKDICDVVPSFINMSIIYMSYLKIVWTEMKILSELLKCDLKLWIPYPLESVFIQGIVQQCL
jgi:hypothetical protein